MWSAHRYCRFKLVDNKVPHIAGLTLTAFISLKFPTLSGDRNSDATTMLRVQSSLNRMVLWSEISTSSFTSSHMNIFLLKFEED